MICRVNIMFFCFCELLLTNTERKVEKKVVWEKLHYLL